MTPEELYQKLKKESDGRYLHILNMILKEQEEHTAALRQIRDQQIVINKLKEGSDV